MARSYDRIDRMLNKIGAIWITMPDIRFGQFVHNMIESRIPERVTLYYFEDDELEKLLDDAISEPTREYFVGLTDYQTLSPKMTNRPIGTFSDEELAAELTRRKESKESDEHKKIEEEYKLRREAIETIRSITSPEDEGAKTCLDVLALRFTKTEWERYK